MQTNTENCYWALLSRKDFNFLYLSPWLSNNLKNESSDLLLGTSIFDYFRPDEKMLAQKDLTRVNNNKLSLSITRCHFSTISKIKRKLNLKFSSLSPTTSTFNNNNNHNNNNNNIINFDHGYPYSSSSTSSSSSSSPQIRPISTTALDLSSSTNVDEYIVMDIGISLVSHDIILACFHSDDGRVHNGDKCSCGESFEFTQKTIDELNKCLNNKNSSSPNGSAIKFTTPPSTPHSEKFFPGNNPLFPPPPPSDRIFQIFDRKSKDLILTWPNPAISFTDNSNNNSYYNKNDFSKLILDCVNNDNKINNYKNYNTPNCLKATVHDKRLLLLSSSGSYGHVESLIIPYGNIIFASFQILSNPSSSKLSLTNNNIIGNGNFSESTPCSPTSTLKLTTPICMTAVTGSGGDDYRSGDKRPRSLSPLLSISSLQQPQHHHTLYSKRHKMSSPNNNNNKLSLFPSQPRPLVVDDSAYNTSNPISSPNHHHHNNNNDNNSQHLFPQQHYNNNNNNDNEKPSIPLLQQPYFINHHNYNVYHHNNYQNHNDLHVHNNNNHNNLHINHEIHNGNGNNTTYPSPKSHNNNLPFISHNPSSSISSPQPSHSFAQNNNHHINHQYQQPPLLSSTTAATATTTTIPKSQKPNSSSLRSPVSSQRKNNNGLKECESCHTNTSPEWRRGPTGHKTLCNACGLRYSRTIARENRKKEQAQSEEEMRKREQRERDDMARERAQRMMDHHPLMNNSHAFYYK